MVDLDALERIDVFDGTEFTTLYLESVENNEFINLFVETPNGNVRETKTELYKALNGDYFIYWDFIRTYNDIQRVFIKKDVICALQC